MPESESQVSRHQYRCGGVSIGPSTAEHPSQCPYCYPDAQLPDGTDTTLLLDAVAADPSLVLYLHTADGEARTRTSNPLIEDEVRRVDVEWWFSPQPATADESWYGVNVDASPTAYDTRDRDDVVTAMSDTLYEDVRVISIEQAPQTVQDELGDEVDDE